MKILKQLIFIFILFKGSQALCSDIGSLKAKANQLESQISILKAEIIRLENNQNCNKLKSKLCYVDKLSLAAILQTLILAIAVQKYYESDNLLDGIKRGAMCEFVASPVLSYMTYSGLKENGIIGN